MLELLTLVLAVAGLILHYVKGKTKSTLDDKASDLVDKAQEYLPKK